MFKTEQFRRFCLDSACLTHCSFQVMGYHHSDQIPQGKAISERTIQDRHVVIRGEKQGLPDDFRINDLSGRPKRRPRDSVV